MIKFLLSAVSMVSSGGWLGLIQLALQAVQAIMNYASDRQLLTAGAKQQIARDLVALSKRSEIAAEVDEEIRAWDMKTIDDFIGEDFV